MQNDDMRKPPRYKKSHRGPQYVSALCVVGSVNNNIRGAMQKVINKL